MAWNPTLPATQQGLNVLGISIGHKAFVQRFLENKTQEQQVLFQLIPWVNDPQSAYFLLPKCGSTRANFWLRALRPEDTESFARRHDENVWTCLRQIPGTPNAPSGAHTLATLALSASGLGLASEVRVRPAAHCANWTDSHRMVRQRYQAIAERMTDGLEANDPLTCLTAPHSVRRSQSPHSPRLDGNSGLPGSWGEEVWPGLSDSSRALLRSQHGPLAFAPLIALPTSKATQVDAQPFRVFLCRRLHLRLPMWPPTRLIWPSSCSVRRGRGVGEKGLPVGGGCGSSVQRGWSSCFQQPPRPGHGLGRVQQPGRTTSGGCRRLSHSVARCTARHRHDLDVLSVVTGLPGPGRPATMGQHWMTLVVARSALTLNCLGTGEGHAWWSWLQRLVAGGASRLPTSWSVWRRRFTLCAAGQGPPGLHQEVERCSGLFSSARVLCFLAGPPSSAGSRGHHFSERGGARCQDCLSEGPIAVLD